MRRPCLPAPLSRHHRIHPRHVPSPASHRQRPWSLACPISNGGQSNHMAWVPRCRVLEIGLILIPSPIHVALGLRTLRREKLILGVEKASLRQRPALLAATRDGGDSAGVPVLPSGNDAPVGVSSGLSNDALAGVGALRWPAVCSSRNAHLRPCPKPNGIFGMNTRQTRPIY